MTQRTRRYLCVCTVRTCEGDYTHGIMARGLIEIGVACDDRCVQAGREVNERGAALVEVSGLSSDRIDRHFALLYGVAVGLQARLDN